MQPPPLRVRIPVLVASFLLGGIGLTAALGWGPLDPPAGAVAPTAKPLSEVEPRIAINATNTPGDGNSLFKITASGSYYLTGNIAGVAAKSGIEIAASNVTIDLMGFDVRGVAGSLQGIASSGSINNVVIRNGSVGGWSTGGVSIGGNGVFACQNIRADSNTGNGISFDTGLVEGCTASNNTGVGIRVSQGGTITRCFAKSNGGVGIDAGIISSVISCASESNTGNGIVASSSCVVAQCSSQQNGGAGFVLDFASLLTDSASRLNTGVGIDARGGASVRGCTVDRNSQDGILVASRSLIINNSLTLNGQDTATTGAGIRITGADNRVEGNNCTGNDNGIRADAVGSIIRGNTCSGNSSNWEIAIGNSVGPIAVAGTNAAAISGNGPAASTLGSTDPSANYSY